MRTLLSATLAVLLVAAVTAQSSQPSGDASSAQALIDKISHVLSALGGVDGAVSKLGYISSLVKKAYTDDGIGGWMARNLIKMELNALKQKAMATEKDMINNLLDQLEAKVGLKSATYSDDAIAENYIFSDAVKRAISLIRDSMKEIVSEISQAQKEHDEAAGKINKDAMNKLTEHLNALKEKLRGLGKKLIDKLTGRDKTAEVYGDNGGIRYQMIEVPSDNYIFGEMIKVAMQQLRERIFKYIEMIGEAKREAQKALGKHKEQALKHLEELKKVLQKSLASLKDALLGRKTADDINKEIEEEDKEIEKIEEENMEAEKATFALMASENYFIDGIVKDLIAQLRVKILEFIEQIGKAKREVQKQTGEAKEVAKKHLEELKEKLKKMKKDLIDALFGKKTAEELEEDLKEKTL